MVENTGMKEGKWTARIKKKKNTHTHINIYLQGRTFSIQLDTSLFSNCHHNFKDYFLMWKMW